MKSIANAVIKNTQKKAKIFVEMGQFVEFKLFDADDSKKDEPLGR